QGPGELPRRHREEELAPALAHVLECRAEEQVSGHLALPPFVDHPEEDRFRLDDVARPDGKEKRPAEVRDFARHDERRFRRRRGFFLRSDEGNNLRKGRGWKAGWN